MTDSEKLIITSAENPDLDGVACSFAYAEFLQQIGKKADYAIFGNPLEEAKFVGVKAGIKIKKAKKLSGTEKFVLTEFVLTDTSIVSRIAKSINPNNVVEIIDHRKLNTAHVFCNAKTQIELVGAAATLIAEKFMNNKIPISNESRILLFYAIISNTVNFKNNVTTDRDRKAAAWLKRKLHLEKNYLRKFFQVKSKIGNLRKAIEDYMGIYDFSGTRICIAQFEMLNAEEFVRKNEKKISKVFSTLIKNADGWLLTSIDIEKCDNTFYSTNRSVKDALETILHVKFRDSIATRKGIIMRKELGPMLDDYFKNRS